MKIRRTAVAVAALSIGALGVPVAASATGSSSSGPDAFGLVKGGTVLVRFDTDKPSRVKKAGDLKLSDDTALVGIDRRVQNGRLYGVGDKGGIYTLVGRSIRATKVGQLTVALDGTSFGVDFNPAANALRIISNTGQNLRQPFGTADVPSGPTVADGTLNYLTVTAPGVTGAAYTNNDLNADTATSLFDLDTTLDQVALQSPANSGSLAPTGKLGVDAATDTGFDVFSDLKAGKTVANQGYAVLGVGGRTGLYSVDLLTGATSLKGQFPTEVTDIAVQLDR